MSILGVMWHFFCDLTPSWVRMSGGKNGTKNDCFLHELKKCEKVASKHHLFYYMVSCQNTANTIVFGWFALGARSYKSEENTGICNAF